MESQWYVVKVLPGKERSLKDEFNKQIELGNIKNVNRFVCPTEKEFKLIKNKKVIRERVLYSGYLYFETERKLTSEELKLLSGLNGLMGMMGDKTPVILRDTDVKRILKDDELGEYNESKKINYTIGENILIVDGPFKSFNGKISNIINEKVSIEVKIFGRNTNVELTLSQIEKS
jgi:transcription termination/antitermination protein NusG